ncbi:hypothetical protein [Ectopseudomonas guguanensis]|jgi:hypothetical protein|uniref:hypothetical protein n=1 Tax=Ectopseudomonas guguanensis TaxID=1198456 RepID=UPI001114482F|nr:MULTISPECIES: hypothetical protein [Pseudomonas]MDR8016910.1 hypothetical protein [Pseudomonas guguanensis]MPT16659.1 hypothetical protein [Pseudomonas sp.]WJH58639.1 hypothetical protein FE254_21875 [Pseudomonas guguanensis]
MSTSAEKKAEPLASDCVVTASPRPDGSLLISVKQGDRKIRRVVDHSCLIQEVARSIKFELSEMKSQEEVIKAVQNYGPKILPTFANQPIYRTRCSRMWEMRKLNGQ